MNRALLIVFGLATVALADEPSIVASSTVIGRNYGFPGEREDVGTLALAIEINVYLKNLELSSISPIEGETFFAFLVPVRARFRAHEELTVEVGALLGHDFGDEDELNVADPLVRLVLEPEPGVFIIAGTILPTHWIHDALHDDVQRLRTGAEQGVQLRVDRDRFKEDLWINWRIREDEMTAEEFEVGIATRGVFLRECLHLDVQVLIAHVGGQRSSDDRVENNVVVLGGVSYGVRPGSDLVHEVRGGVRGFFSSDDGRDLPDEEGSGYEIFVVLDLHPVPDVLLRGSASWFFGDDLLARRGDPLYGLDDYGQAGVDAVFAMDSGVTVEVGAVAQLTDDELNYTFKITFVWGGSFPITRS